MDKNIVNIIIVAIIASVVLFSGCVEEETTQPTETPAVTPTPTSAPEPEMESPTIISTPTPTPEATATPRATIEPPDVTLKPGYKWYQDDEFGFRIGYPKDWEEENLGLGEGQEAGISFGSDAITPSTDIPEAHVAVVVWSNSTSVRFWEKPGWVEHGGLEKGKEMGMISKYGNVTINGREGFEIVFDPFMTEFGSKTPVMRERVVIFTVDDLDYVVMAYANTPEGDLYSKYESTFDDVINSFVIE